MRPHGSDLGKVLVVLAVVVACSAGGGSGDEPLPGTGTPPEATDVPSTAAVASGSASVAVTSPTPTETSGATGGAVLIRTFPVVEGGCDSIGIDDPVYGTLDGDPADAPDAVWLTDPEGTRLVIVWPAGFSATFEPELALRSSEEIVVARRGDAVMFQVARADAAGTEADPYRASGLVVAGRFAPGDWPLEPAFSGCYPIGDR